MEIVIIVTFPTILLLWLMAYEIVGTPVFSEVLELEKFPSRYLASTTKGSFNHVFDCSGFYIEFKVYFRSIYCFWFFEVPFENRI